MKICSILAGQLDSDITSDSLPDGCTERVTRRSRQSTRAKVDTRLASPPFRCARAAASAPRPSCLCAQTHATAEGPRKDREAPPFDQRQSRNAPPPVQTIPGMCALFLGCGVRRNSTTSQAISPAASAVGAVPTAHSQCLIDTQHALLCRTRATPTMRSVLFPARKQCEIEQQGM